MCRPRPSPTSVGRRCATRRLQQSGLRFGPEVPVRTIEVTDPTIEAIPQAEREVIGEKVSYRLAQQPGSYVVLKYVRPVVKRRGSETMLTAPAPVNVLERSGGRRELPWCDAHRQVLLASAAVSSASASSQRGYHAQPLHCGVLDEPRHRPAGAARRCAECACAREWGAGDGRDFAQSGARGEGQDAHRVAVCSFDRGFHSPANRAQLDAMLDLDVLARKGRLSVAERERESAPAFAQARRQHPAVESAINNLEHRGLDRVRSHGAAGFAHTVALSILAANLHRIGVLVRRRMREAQRRRRRRAA